MTVFEVKADLVIQVKNSFQRKIQARNLDLDN